MVKRKREDISPNRRPTNSLLDLEVNPIETSLLYYANRHLDARSTLLAKSLDRRRGVAAVDLSPTPTTNQNRSPLSYTQRSATRAGLMSQPTVFKPTVPRKKET